MKIFSRTSVTTVALVVLGMVTASLSTGTVSLRPDRMVFSMVSGIQHVVALIGQGVTATFQSVGELRELRHDYETLLSEVEEYRNLEGRLRQLEGENTRLREQLGFAAHSAYPVLSARVIAREGNQYFSSFTINRGRRHGVVSGQTVIAFAEGSEGLVGVVETVAGGSSLVVPVFSAGAYIAARLDRSRHEGLIQGSGDRYQPLIMSYVPREARDEIRYQDLVVTSGLNSIYPEGLPVGRVTRVDALSFEPSLELLVQSIVDFSRLEYVFVVSSSGDRNGSGEM